MLPAQDSVLKCGAAICLSASTGAFVAILAMLAPSNPLATAPSHLMLLAVVMIRRGSIPQCLPGKAVWSTRTRKA